MSAAWTGIVGRGSQIAETLVVWGILQQQISALLGPEVNLVLQDVNAAHPIMVLSPADLADMVVKSIYPEAEAAGEAAKSGIDADRFHRMVLDTGEPPGLETVLQMYRRGLIPWDSGNLDQPSVVTAILTSRIKNLWTDPIKGVSLVPISPADAVEAALKGQRPQAEMEKEAYASGVTAERFQILLDTAGDPPSPMELVELVRRGLIPESGLGPQVTSFQQGIYEGRTKNKWWTEFLALREYVPPPRSIATLQSRGVIDAAEATKLYQDAGLTPELAAIYARSAVAHKLTAHKELAVGQVEKLYYDHLITVDQATAMLAQLGYDGPEAAFILELQDFSRAQAAYTSAISRVGTLYVNHKIDKDAVVKALDALDVPAQGRARLVAEWDAERTANVHVLTPAEVVDGWFEGAYDAGAAIAKLEQMGYTAYDAWVKLVIKNKGVDGLPKAPAGQL